MTKELRVALAWGGGMILLAIGATAARKLGYIDQDMLLRLVISINGLMIAYYGNLTPKAVAPNSIARQVSRVAGWSLLLSGLIYTGLWAFAPIRLALIAGSGVVAAGVIVSLSYCFWLRQRARADVSTRT